MIYATWPLWTLPLAFIVVCVGCAWLQVATVMVYRHYREWREK